MPGRTEYTRFLLFATLFAATFAAFVYPGLPFLAFPHWETPFMVIVLLLQSRRDRRRAERRFRERGEFACHVREVPGGGAGLSGRWRGAVVVPSHRRLAITGRAADRPPTAHVTWDEPVDEGLVQLRDVVEMAQREPTFTESLRFGPGARVVRCKADGAVVEIAGAQRYLHPMLRTIKGTPSSA